MTATAASVIVVSRHRTSALIRCLTGIAQQDHRGFEVIVVADPEAACAVRTLGMAVKLIEFDEANISAARNAGLALAAATVVAFIDDDAVPEPTWLSRLVAPFEDPRVVAGTGFVRGRNGISMQWRCVEVDQFGNDHPLAVPDHVTLHSGTSQRAVKTTGTNCAFRRDALLRIGGFDPAFRFYLDEADVNLRLAPFGLTAVVPMSQVHHGYEASARRRADRVPVSLHEIAASTAVFLRRHAPLSDLDAAYRHLAAHQLARIDTHRAAGRLTNAEGVRLVTGVKKGWDDGLGRDLTALVPFHGSAVFQHLPGTGPRPGLLLAGRIWQRRSLDTRAQAAVADGFTVTVICLAPTMRAHRQHFAAKGYWVHEGGLFGRSDRSGPRFRITRFRKRIAEEMANISLLRPVI